MKWLHTWAGTAAAVITVVAAILGGLGWLIALNAKVDALARKIEALEQSASVKSAPDPVKAACAELAKKLGDPYNVSTSPKEAMNELGCIRAN